MSYTSASSGSLLLAIVQELCHIELHTRHHLILFLLLRPLLVCNIALRVYIKYVFRLASLSDLRLALLSWLLPRLILLVIIMRLQFDFTKGDGLIFRWPQIERCGCGVVGPEVLGAAGR